MNRNTKKRFKNMMKVNNKTMEILYFHDKKVRKKSLKTF